MRERGKTFQVKAGPGSFMADVDVSADMMSVLSHCEVCGIQSSAHICWKCEKNGHQVETYHHHRG